MVCWYFVKKAVHLKKSLCLSFVRRDHCNHAERSAGAGMPPEPRSGSAGKCDDLLLNINTTAPVCWHHDFYCYSIMKEIIRLCVFYRGTRSTNDLLGPTPTLTPAQIPMRWILSKPSSTLLRRNYCKNHRNPSAVYWQWILVIFLKVSTSAANQLIQQQLLQILLNFLIQQANTPATTTTAATTTAATTVTTPRVGTT